jgi:hypothetical protein
VQKLTWKRVKITRLRVRYCKFCKTHTRVWCLHAGCDINTQECDFNTDKSDFNTHKCDLHTKSVIFIHTSVTKTRKVWFLHARLWNYPTKMNVRLPKQSGLGFEWWLHDTQKCDFDTHECDFLTHACDLNTLRVELLYNNTNINLSWRHMPAAV